MHGHVRSRGVVDGVSYDDGVDHSLSRDGVKGQPSFILRGQCHQLGHKERECLRTRTVEEKDKVNPLQAKNKSNKIRGKIKDNLSKKKKAAPVSHSSSVQSR